MNPLLMHTNSELAKMRFNENYMFNLVKTNTVLLVTPDEGVGFILIPIRLGVGGGGI